MKLALTVQYAVSSAGLPAEEDFRRWARAALEGRREEAALTVRVVDEAESAALNQRYRGRPGPTNVLSFPFQPPSPVENDLLGDLVICAPLVQLQAGEQGKPEQAHWAHMVVHGTLHLLGHDHQEPAQAAEMETLERDILAQLGFADPYQLNGET